MVETVSTSPKSYLTGDKDFHVGYFITLRWSRPDTIMTRDILQRQLKTVFFARESIYRSRVAYLLTPVFIRLVRMCKTHMKKKRPNIFVLNVPFNYSWTLITLFFWPYALHITCVYAVCICLAGTLKPVWSVCDLFNDII